MRIASWNINGVKARIDGLVTWLRDTNPEDPRKVFRVTDGVLHISGDGFGYVATSDAYRDYHAGRMGRLPA